MTFTCKGCKKREPGCHAKCEKYQAEKATWEEEKAQRRKEEQIQNRLTEHVISSVQKTRKRKGKARWGQYYEQ